MTNDDPKDRTEGEATEPTEPTKDPAATESPAEKEGDDDEDEGED